MAILGIVALTLVYFVIWSPEMIFVDRDHRTLSNTTTPTTNPAVAPSVTSSALLEYGALEHDRVEAYTTTASTLLTVVAPIPTGQVSTSTEALRIAERTPSAFSSHRKRDIAVRHTRRGFFQGGQEFVFGPYRPSSPTYTLILTCEGKPYTRGLGFALTYPNGTLVGDGLSKTTPLFYVWTRWQLTYPNILLKALLDDPTQSPDCPLGHCYSRAIPGTEGIRLARLLKPDEGEFWCYHTTQRSVSRLAVQLGKTSLMHGEDLRAEVVEPLSFYTQHFMAERMKTTYPALEIGLVLGFTIGIIVLLILYKLGYYVFHVVVVGMIRLWALAQRCYNCAGMRCAALGAGCKRCWGKIKLRWRGHGVLVIIGERDEGEELKDLRSVPPSYEQATAQVWEEEMDRAV
ncbi:hypothetical protein P171DRAFT_488442 [Karstenula rhodostoma CBS 690.94]|uniref:Uncharacterized protein n=1 Tax=Karstenula rhodostoma CBS 690.94 TaxID=1392251 RepID=A0A9P4PCW5_9PLEO|nr:hypothetical protein P171DRAFT_488442 [Karstenula rhodostoma CBS 690.94]